MDYRHFGSALEEHHFDVRMEICARVRLPDETGRPNCPVADKPVQASNHPFKAESLIRISNMDTYRT